MEPPSRRQVTGRKQSLREQVLQDLRAEIVSGRVEGGHVYSVPALATDLGVSTTPVREALLELQRQGLVTPLPNRGFQVAVPSTEELLEMLKLRELLETYALDRLAAREEKDLTRLYAIAERISDAVEQRDPVAYVAADREFHLALVDEAGISKLTTFISDLRDHMRLIGLETEQGFARQEASAAEHFQLLDLLTAGDTEGVRGIISHHISAWEAVLRAGMAADHPTATTTDAM
ncbi:GntR family transcriptional regulator [Streptomyces sp. NPDC056669]|uniref:GntR family transcriptional regulator n=1 Tax=unclassified Streptomyces TaxID=2593676 RepID=UPI00364E4D4C